MDRMRAIEYFLAAAQAGSFAGAARRLDVSVPAVLKGVEALEARLSARLFERSTRGLSLTASGLVYREACRPLVAELDALDESIGRANRRPAGVLVVAAHPQIARWLLQPALARFCALNPEIVIDLRVIHRFNDAEAAAAEVLVLHGWPEVPDMVHRKLGRPRSFIGASPEYWARHGMPKHPTDLQAHACLNLRNPSGTLIDLWEFERAGERVSVKVAGWMSSNDREVLLDLVMAGEGVGRFSHLMSIEPLQAGRIVPVLTDWDVLAGAPLNLLYRPSLRRAPRVRLFIDFIDERLRELDAEAPTSLGAMPMPRPDWYRRGYGRASSALRARR